MVAPKPPGCQPLGAALELIVADQLQDSLLREIDDELRHEKYAKLWKKYGKYVVAFAVLLVVGVAGYQGWRSWDLKTRTEQSNRFLAALDLRANGDLESARKALAELAGDAGKGYATLARFQEAALMENLGDGKAQLPLTRPCRATARCRNPSASLRSSWAPYFNWTAAIPPPSASVSPP
jgi:hypothetical protein